MDRDEVARHQRTRLYGGMIEAISQRGYASTTVAHVISLAGVSRRAFYEQFRNKEHCFLATHDIVVARSRKHVLQAWDSERGWENRLHASCKTFLEEIIAEPKGARLVLIDSLGIGVQSRERLHFAGTAYERLLTEAFQTSADPVPLPRIVSRAIVGGMRYVVYNRVREDRLPELRTLADELLDWVEAYRTPALARLRAMARSKAPRIPPAAAAFLAADDKRSRLLGAVVHLTLDEGYRELTDPRIAQFAGVSTEAFHKQFRNKEECYLVAIDEFVDEALAVVEHVAGHAHSWPEAVSLGMRAFIQHVVARPGLLRLTFVDLFELGPGMIGRMTTAIDRLTGLLLTNSPSPRRAPEIVHETVAGAIWDIFGIYSASDRIRYLPCLADYIAFMALAPYTGAKEAIDAIEEARRQPKLLAALAANVRPSSPAANAGSSSPAGSLSPLPAGSRSSTATKSASAKARSASGRAKSASGKASGAAPAGSKSAPPASAKAKPARASKPAAGSKRASQAKRDAGEQPKKPAGKARRLPEQPSTASRSRRRPPR